MPAPKVKKLKNETPRRHEERQRMSDILWSFGFLYPATYAARLQKEGMGPTELRQRVNVSAPLDTPFEKARLVVGSLEHSHNMLRKPVYYGPQKNTNKARREAKRNLLITAKQLIKGDF